MLSKSTYTQDYIEVDARSLYRRVRLVILAAVEVIRGGWERAVVDS